MKGSTVGDIMIRGQDSGQCNNAGLYTAYGDQFMIGSCQTISVVTSTIISTGLPGFFRQPRMKTMVNTTTMSSAPICGMNCQWSNPVKNSTGRGRPSTFGLATRGSTAPRPTATNTPRKPSHARSEITRPQLGPVPFGPGESARVSGGRDSCVVIGFPLRNDRPGAN